MNSIFNKWSLAAPTTGATATPAATPTETTKGISMTWLIALLNLIPVIANGIHTLHADKTAATKSQMATDALNLVIQGAQAAAPASEQGLVAQVAPIAQQTLQTTLTALQTATAPVTPAATA